MSERLLNVKWWVTDRGGFFAQVEYFTVTWKHGPCIPSCVELTASSNRFSVDIVGLSKNIKILTLMTWVNMSLNDHFRYHSTSSSVSWFEILKLRYLINQTSYFSTYWMRKSVTCKESLMICFHAHLITFLFSSFIEVSCHTRDFNWRLKHRLHYFSSSSALLFLK